MKQLPYATALISISVAVALWLIATWLEGDSPRLVPRPGEGTGFVNSEVRPDTPVQVTPDLNRCEQVEDALRHKVDDAQICSTDDDCTLFDYGYPIQCLTSVAKTEITALRLEFRNYGERCENRLYYDCPTGSMERQAVCRNNRCAVELQSTEFLEDETLDYLGLEPR